MSKFIRSAQVFFHGAQGAVKHRKKSFSNGVGRGETIKGKKIFFWFVETESKNEIDGIWAAIRKEGREIEPLSFPTGIRNRYRQILCGKME